MREISSANESSRGSHTFTCPVLFFPTSVPSMRESQGWCTLLSLTRFRVSREVGGRGAERWERWRADSIPRETFIPKLLPIRGDFVRGITLGWFPSMLEYWSRNISSKKKRKSWKSFVRSSKRGVRLFINLLQILLSRISKNLGIFDLSGQVYYKLTECKFLARADLPGEKLHRLRFTNLTVFSKYIFSF